MQIKDYTTDSNGLLVDNLAFSLLQKQTGLRFIVA